MNSPFRVAVINDEISQDFGHAVDVASREFGMQWIEVREMWNKNIMKLDSKEIDEARQILERAKMRVTDIASPVFKVDWPGAPLSKAAERRDTFNADYTFKQQDEMLDRSFELAKAFNTDRVRIFDFWRLDDQTPYRAAIDDKLREAADKAAKKNIILILENEYACNTATGAEAARTLSAVQASNFMVNWDPGNAAMRGENAFPDGYNKLPKDRIGHVHCQAIPQLRPTAVVGTNASKVKALAEKYGLSAFNDLREFLGHRPLDLVIIGSPSGVHAKEGIAACEQGLHVLVEKPIDVSTQRADQLIRSAKTNGVKLGVLFQDRLKPDILRLRDRIKSGKLGRILLVEASVKWYRPPEYYSNSKWRGTASLDGGGALMNQGIHTVDLLLYLLGGIDRVQAVTKAALQQNQSEAR